MNNEVSILFYIKRAKANKEGLAPIYARITILAKRFEFSTNRFAAVEKWTSEGSRVKGFSEEARSINNYLDELRIKIVMAEKSLFKRDIPITSENLKNELLGISERNRTLIPIFQDHNDRIKALLGQEYAPGTLERYKTSLKHTQDFLEWKYNISDIELDKIDHALICDYEFYLRSVRKCANNSAIKYIKNFKKIVRKKSRKVSFKKRS